MKSTNHFCQGTSTLEALRSMLVYPLRSQWRLFRTGPHPSSDDRVIHQVQIGRISMKIADYRKSKTVRAVFREISRNEIGLRTLSLPPAAVILDVGAHVGVVSIYLAKRFPDARIFAFEPLGVNYANLVENVRRNKVDNIRTFNLAITADGSRFRFCGGPGANTGGASACVSSVLSGRHNQEVDSTTLDNLMADLDLTSVDLLKIDCEGSEHAALLTFEGLNRVQRLIGEFHENTSLTNQGYTNARLLKHVSRRLPGRPINVKQIRMAD